MIDEAAQATEAGTLIPMILNIRTCIIIGSKPVPVGGISLIFFSRKDSQQLSAVVKSQEAQKVNSHQSTFERYQKRSPQFVHLPRRVPGAGISVPSLDRVCFSVHYRMNPLLSRIHSVIFLRRHGRFLTHPAYCSDPDQFGIDIWNLDQSNSPTTKLGNVLPAMHGGCGSTSRKPIWQYLAS